MPDISTAALRRGQLSRMKRYILIYGRVGGVLITALKLMEYRFLVLEHSLEIYGGLVAAVFAGVCSWLGSPVPPAETFALNRGKLDELGITPRVLEILSKPEPQGDTNMMKKTILRFGLMSGVVSSLMMLATVPFIDKLGDWGELYGYTAIVPVLPAGFLWRAVLPRRRRRNAFYVVTWEILYFNYMVWSLP